MLSSRDISACDNPSSSRLRSFFPRSIILSLALALSLCRCPRASSRFFPRSIISLSLFSSHAMSVRLSFCTL